MITNLGFAAYLMLKGYKLLESPSRGEDGKFVFKFSIDEQSHKNLLHEYSVGEFAKFDSCIVNLKRMIPRY